MAIKVPVIDKVRRRLTGTIDMPDINMKPSSQYLVNRVHTVWDENRGSPYLRHKKLFDIAVAHLPKDPGSVYYIVDDGDIIQDIGSHRLSVREVTPSERKAYVLRMMNKGWLPQNTDPNSVRLCRAEYMIDPNEFFRGLEIDSRTRESRWPELVNLWCTENLNKDPRLVDSFKATQIPFINVIPGNWQPYNAHAIWLTNTGTGKTTFNEIAGGTASVDLSIAGLFGANVDDYRKQQVGALQGHGLQLIDEIEQLRKFEYSNQVLLSLLTYLEQGKVERRLRIPIRCEGTKAVILASNPTSNDPLDSVLQFLHMLQGDSDPTRMGRRVAFFLAGNDYQRVNIDRPVPTLRSVIPQIIKFTMLKHWKGKVSKVFKSQMGWINDERKNYNDICTTFELKGRACPNEAVGRFITGLGYGLQRLRMSTIRIIMLDNLHLVGYGAGFKDMKDLMIEQRDGVFQRLVDYNMRSVNNIILEMDKVQPTKECAQEIHARFPKLSLRDIGSRIGVSHEAVRKWLNE